MNQPTTPFADLATSVMPDTPAARLSRTCDVDNRTAGRWLTGAIDVPDDVARFVADQAEALKDFHPGPALDEIAAKADAAGVDVEVLGSWIAAKYEQIVGRRIK